MKTLASNTAALAAALFLAAAGTSFAQATITWDGSGTGTSSVLNNTFWVGDTAPGSGDTALFDSTSIANAIVVDLISNSTPVTWTVGNVTKNAVGTQIIQGAGGAGAATNTVNVLGNLTRSGAGTGTLTIRASTGILNVQVGGNLSTTAGSGIMEFGAQGGASTGTGRIGNVTVSGSTTVGAGDLLRVNAIATGSSVNLGAMTVNGTFSPIAGNSDAANGTLDGSTSIISMSSLSGNGTIEGAKGNATLITTGVISVNGTTSTTFSGTIRDAASGASANNRVALTKLGASTLTLNGTNTYTGNTTVSAGTLLINSSLAAGSASTVNGTGTLGGSGTINGATTIQSGGTLLGGTGNLTTDLTLANNVTFLSGSKISLALGAPGSNSSIIRTGGTWSFQTDQQFSFIDLGAAPGTYTGLITGLAADPGVSGWQILNSGWSGTFSYNSGSVDLNISAIPEPSTWALLAISLTSLIIFRRRRA